MNSQQYTADEIMDKDILDLMGAQNMTPEEKEELYQKMIETIEMRVLARVDDQLSDQDVEQIKKAVEEKNKDAFFQVLTAKGIDVDKIYAEEALVYKFEMIELMNNKTEE